MHLVGRIKAGRKACFSGEGLFFFLLDAKETLAWHWNASSGDLISQNLNHFTGTQVKKKEKKRQELILRVKESTKIR